MRFDLGAIERRAEGDGPIHRLGVRSKIVATMAFAVAVALEPVGWGAWIGLGAVPILILVAISGVGWPYVAGRWLGFLSLVGFLGGMVALSHPARATLGWGGVLGVILLKNSLIFLAVLVLVATTPSRLLFAGMGRLGMPPVLVSTLHFMLRYLHVLAAELARMNLARRARTYRKSSGFDWVRRSGLIGRLVVRSVERGERVHGAMLARGWDGTIRSLEDGGTDPR